MNDKANEYEPRVKTLTHTVAFDFILWGAVVMIAGLLLTPQSYSFAMPQTLFSWSWGLLLPLIVGCLLTVFLIHALFEAATWSAAGVIAILITPLISGIRETFHDLPVAANFFMSIGSVAIQMGVGALIFLAMLRYFIPEYFDADYE